jgi:hypothetical protein
MAINNLKFKGVSPSALYKGSDVVSALYKGSDKIWPLGVEVLNYGGAEIAVGLGSQVSIDISGWNVQAGDMFIYLSATCFAFNTNCSKSGGGQATVVQAAPLSNNLSKFNLHYMVADGTETILSCSSVNDSSVSCMFVHVRNAAIPVIADVTVQDGNNGPTTPSNFTAEDVFLTQCYGVSNVPVPITTNASLQGSSVSVTKAYQGTALASGFGNWGAVGSGYIVESGTYSGANQLGVFQTYPNISVGSLSVTLRPET